MSDVQLAAFQASSFERFSQMDADKKEAVKREVRTPVRARQASPVCHRGMLKAAIQKVLVNIEPGLIFYRRVVMLSVIRLLCLGLVSSLVMADTGFAEKYQIDRSHSSVGFSIRHFVSRTAGRFNQFSGTIDYDPAAPEKMMIETTIQARSIDTGNERRDGHLRGADFFEVETYPTIAFKSTSAVKEGEKILVTGDLTMHGVTKSITMPVTVLGIGTHPQRNTPLAGFETELTLLCSDFGVNSWANFANVLGDEVRVNITIEAGPPRQGRGQQGRRGGGGRGGQGGRGGGGN